jgi:hypothetical protein
MTRTTCASRTQAQRRGADTHLQWRDGADFPVDGAPLATASIVFRGGADYSGRQMEYFRPRTPPEIFRRMFPNYARQNSGPRRSA